MKAAPFDYHAPRTTNEAVQMLADLPNVKVLAGGQSLVPMLAARSLSFDHLVDLRHVDALRGIEQRGDALWIGAMTPQSTAEHSPLVHSLVPLLAKAIPLVAHFQIRNRGTVGGSIMHADAVGEIPCVALALDAVFEVASARGGREIAAADMFVASRVTALAADEVLTGIRFPIWQGTVGTAVEELSPRYADPAIAGACVQVQLDGGRVERCAIGLISLGSTSERARAAEHTVVAQHVDGIDAAALGRAAVASLTSIPSDLNGSADYRARVGATMVARAWQRAVEEATHG